MHQQKYVDHVIRSRQKLSNKILTPLSIDLKKSASIRPTKEPLKALDYMYFVSEFTSMAWKQTECTSFRQAAEPARGRAGARGRDRRPPPPRPAPRSTATVILQQAAALRAKQTGLGGTSCSCFRLGKLITRFRHGYRQVKRKR